MGDSVTKKALIACANYWESPIQVGDHHLARGLVQRGYEVAFISNPVSPFHLLARSMPLRAERLRSYRSGGRRHLEGKLWSYCPGALVVPNHRPPFRSRWLMNHWHRGTFPRVDRRVRAEGFGKVDLLCVREAKQSFWADRIAYDKLVFRVADRDSSFPGQSPHLRELETRLAQRADLVVYTASNLSDYVQDLGARRSVHLPNGVDFGHFDRADLEPPPDLAHLRSPIAIYAGSLDAWFDHELVDHAARALPEINFVLIGPTSPAVERVAGQRSNVHALGPRPFADLPRYLHRADVGMIPFEVTKHRALIDSVNPIKLYEYFACDLPVVSTAWQELERLASPAFLCRSRDEFVDGLRRALTDLDGERSGTPERREFAAAHDWSCRIDTLLRELGVLSPVGQG